MGLPRGFRPKPLNDSLQNEPCPDTILVIKLPDTYCLRVMSRSVFWAAVLLSLPFFGSIFGGNLASLVIVDDISVDSGSGSVHFEGLDSVVQDLSSEGFINKGDKALVWGSSMMFNSIFSIGNGIDLVLESDLEKLATIGDEMFDIAFLSSFVDTQFVDRVIKVGGIIVVQLNNGISDSYERLWNYRIEYLRKYDFTVAAMRKTAVANELFDSPAKRRLCQLTLDDLENVLLEPPRNAESNKLKKIKFLPDLLGDSVRGYLRGIFIDVELAELQGGIMEGFHQNYPMRNEFEMYFLEMVPEEQAMPRVDASDRLEAELTEEMTKRGTICFLDEMFLECKNLW